MADYTPYEQPYCDEQDCCSRAVVLMRWGGEWFPMCQLHATANAAIEPPEETRRLQQEVMCDD